MDAIPPELLKDVVDILDPEAAACIDRGDNFEDDDDHFDVEDEERDTLDVVTPLGGHSAPSKGGIRHISDTPSDSAYSPLTVAEKPLSASTTSSIRPQSSKNPYRWMYNRSLRTNNLSPRQDVPTANTAQKIQQEPTTLTIDKFRPLNNDGSTNYPNETQDGDGERHVTQVTKTFCDWVRSLGGEETNNIEESTILSLFAAGEFVTKIFPFTIS